MPLCFHRRRLTSAFGFQGDAEAEPFIDEHLGAPASVALRQGCRVVAELLQAAQDSGRLGRRPLFGGPERRQAAADHPRKLGLAQTHPPSQGEEWIIGAVRLWKGQATNPNGNAALQEMCGG